MAAYARHWPDKPVLYSFRRCPYAMRARLAILASGLSVELREIVLRDKPEHMIALSPKATVPVLWLPDGRVIDESIDVMRWALSLADPEGWLDLTADQEATANELVLELDGPFKRHLDRYKYANRYEDCDANAHRKACVAHLEGWNARLENHHGWLLDDVPRYVDYALLPFARQFRLADEGFFDTELNLPALQKWLQNYLQSKLYQSIMPKFEPWKAGDAPVIFPQ